ncbi:TonB-dependent receptor [Asticcacaulis excentricus]|uniref:TonB-dependent receptor n=1 Tax=Asticcacaulis excentricus TaxID=78587 RepID=A0A3G9G110_9CAUL|nr:TonB-dependent receptor [Asticcacaulis excentricus]BBF79441.1 TonB-dependent receptor [Asticcacaulis excentricus]
MTSPINGVSSRGARRVIRNMVLCSASGMAMLAGAAYAQDAAPASGDNIETVVITGVRGSLQRSMNIKRNATGVVDAITSEDIGKYPDTNLAESVQRIPGVSIDRTNGEGSTVTVRGFGPGFNLVTLNGRVMPSAQIGAVGTGNITAGGGSRNFDFSSIASDGVSGFEVYKTGKANIASGGIGATLNIKTLRPIGKAGAAGSISAKAVHGENLIDGKDWTPEIAGTYKWTNEDNTFGVALFGQFAEKDVATRQATQNNWNLDTRDQFYSPSSGRLRYASNQTTLLTQITNAPPAGSLVAYPNDSRYALSETHNERTNLVATAQWRPAENWLFTADAVYVKNEATEKRAEQTNWFNRPFDQIIFEKGASGIYNAVFLQENLSGVKDIGFEQQLVGLKSTLKSLGFNAKWDINDKMSLTFDAHSSEGKVLPNNPNGSTAVAISIGAPVISSHSVDFRSDIPVQKYTINDALRGNNNGRLDAGDLGSQVGRTWTNSQTNKVDEFKVDFAYDFDGESRFDGGIDLLKSKMTTTTGSTYQALGDWGISRPGDIAQYAPGLVTTYDLGGLFQDFTPGQSNVAFRGNALDIYRAVAKGYNQSLPTTSLTANTIEEDIKAIYGQLTLKGDFLGKPVGVVAGLRYEKTDVTASALQSVPTAIRWTADNDFAVDFGSGVATLSSQADYDNWLPNLDISWNVRDDVTLRASYSKTIARAAYGNMYATTTVNTPPRPTANGTNPTASSGNPALLPLESSNIDFSAEWYYGPANYVSLGFYNKDVANFIGTGRVTQNLFSLRDPTAATAGSRSGTAKTALSELGQSPTDVNLFTMTALVIKNNGNTTAAKNEYTANSTNGNLNQAFVDQILAAYDITANSTDPLFNFDTSIPVNNKTANIHGFEAAFQHFFGDTGWGLSGSLTTVDGDIGFDNSAAPGTLQFPLLGLSDTYNVTLIYDKGPLSGRLAYNWRDKYIASTNVGSQGDPQYFEAFGVLDASVNYSVTSNIQVTFEALNLTKEHIRQYGRDTSNIYFAQELDTRYQIGVRYKF